MVLLIPEPILAPDSPLGNLAVRSQSRRAGLEGIDPGRRRLRTDGVILCDGRSLPADLVVLCAGSRLTTSAPGICAVGECAEHRGTVWPHMAALAEQVRVLARRLAGDRGAFLDLEGTPGARRYERHRHPEKYPLDVITIRDKTP